MSEKIKVMLVGPRPPQIGGIEFFVQALLDSKLARLCSLRHFDISKPGSRMQTEFKSPMGYARSFKRNFLITCISFGYSIKYFVRFCLLMPFSRISLVHLNSSSYMSFWEKCAYLDVARFWRKKVVMHIHGSSFDRFLHESGGFGRRFLVWHLRRCDAVIALSESWRNFFSGYLPDDRVVVIENGVYLGQFLQIKIIKPAEPTLIFLGEVCRRKGIYDLLPAIQGALASVPNLRSVIVGPGEISKAQKEAEILGISNCVRFTGPQYHQDKVQWLTRSWFLVLPSYAEVFPIVLLEAFACGLPVISTRVGGIPDFVRDGVNGLLIQPGDRAALSMAIVRLAQDASLRGAMAAENLRMAREKYDIDRCAEKVYAVYQRLLNPSATAS